MLQNLPIIDVSESTHYRIKICVNFNQKNIITDTITDKFLLNKIDQFNKLLNNQDVIYGYFQKSNYENNYSIIIVCSLDIDNIYLKN